MRQRLVPIILLFVSGAANSTVIDFELIQGYAIDVADFSQGGIDFVDPRTRNNLYWYDYNAVPGHLEVQQPLGTSGLLVQADWGGTTAPQLNMYGSNDTTFSLNSFVSTSDASFQISGYEDAGVGVSATAWAHLHTLYSEDLGGGLSRYYLTDNFADLEAVVIKIGDSGDSSTFPDIFLDNIQINESFTAAVPIPAAVWLFGSALAGLGWIRRKQTA